MIHFTLKSAFLAFAFCLPSFVSAQAFDFEIDGMYYKFNEDGKSVAVAPCSNYRDSYSGDVVIPSTVTYNSTTYNVSSISDWAFYNCPELLSITFPPSITRAVGDGIFKNSEKFESVYVQDFEAWLNIEFTENPMSYAKNFYVNGETLTSYVIPNTFTEIKKYAFLNLKDLESITIPNTITAIGNSAFSGCSSLRSVSLPNSVTSLENNVFSGCSQLKEVILPESITKISDGLFSESGFTSFTIPEQVTSIGANAFYCCQNLKEVNMNSNAISVGSWAFIACTSLEKVNIKDFDIWCKIEFSDIYSNPLYYAHHIYLNGEEIKIPQLPNQITAIGNASFAGASFTSLRIPEGVDKIGNSAFWGCSELKSLYIPASVTSIGDNAFAGCNGLESITVDENNAYYDSRDNCNAIINSTNNYLLSGCVNTIIPNTVVVIMYNAFYDCDNLKSIDIPNSVTGIGWQAFYGCKGLTSVVIPDNVTLIGNFAFMDCSNLTNLTLGSSVSEIYEGCFENCINLSTIISNAATPPTIFYGRIFDGVNKDECVLIVPDGSVDAYRAAEEWSDFLNISGTESIAVDAEEILIQNGKIMNINNSTIEVYSILGAKVYSGNDSVVNLASGMYIVKSGNKATKVVL
ncbi:MAG: leucine-rich repeat domain-containing protein [Muribaculaceae bacterium]